MSKSTYYTITKGKSITTAGKILVEGDEFVESSIPGGLKSIESLIGNGVIVKSDSVAKSKKPTKVSSKKEDEAAAEKELSALVSGADNKVK